MASTSLVFFPTTLAYKLSISLVICTERLGSATHRGRACLRRTRHCEISYSFHSRLLLMKVRVVNYNDLNTVYARPGLPHPRLGWELLV